MAEQQFFESPEVSRKIYRIYRDYFDMAEKKRRWSLKEAIPWNQCNPGLDPAIAEIVQTFCMVELYLPDYVSKLVPQVRAQRGRAWMLFNWGYEESKHSMALGDWLLHAKMRTEEQMADLDQLVFSHEWQLPHDNPRAMLIYTTFQELATQISYRNLRRVADGRCPGLDRVLQLVSVDEAAHADFFRRIVELHLEEDRAATLEAMRQVINTFKMPATHLWADGAQRRADVKALRIFDDDIFYQDVFEPLIARMGVTRAELRRRNSRREVVLVERKV